MVQPQLPDRSTSSPTSTVTNRALRMIDRHVLTHTTTETKIIGGETRMTTRGIKAKAIIRIGTKTINKTIKSTLKGQDNQSRAQERTSKRERTVQAKITESEMKAMKS